MASARPATSRFQVRKPSLPIAIAVLLIGGVGFLVWQNPDWIVGQSKADENFVTDVAKRGPLRVIVSERGQLDSRSNVTLSSKVEGSSTIISIVPEGTHARGPVNATIAGEVLSIERGEQVASRVDGMGVKVENVRIVVSSPDGDEVQHDVTVGPYTKLLVEVGTTVAVGDPLAGDLLCELDSSVLNEQFKEQVIKFHQAEADLLKAEANVEIQSLQNQSDAAAAKLAKRLALLDIVKFLGEERAERELRNYLAKEHPELEVEGFLKEFAAAAARAASDEDQGEGEFVQQQNEMLGAVTVAEEELARAREVFEFTKRLAGKGYKSLNDLEADRIAVTKAAIALSVAKEKLGLLSDFTRVRTVEEMLANVVETVKAESRTEISGKAAVQAFEKELEARERALGIEQTKLQRLEQQLEACTMYAPQEGVVVYANNSGGRRSSSEQAVIEEGATIRERQQIINLPDLSRMKVATQIHESRISLLKASEAFEALDADASGYVSQDEVQPWVWTALLEQDADENGIVEPSEFSFPATLKIDAYPGETFVGVVHSVASVASQADWMRPNLKQYATEITVVDFKGRELKPGMNAAVEIVVKQRDDVLQIPVQSVVGIGQKRFVWTVESGQPARHEVKVGDTSGTTVEVLEGVEEGADVIMNPRTHFSKEIEDLQGQSGNKTGEKGAAAGKGGPAENGGPGARGGAGGKRPGGGAPGGGKPGGARPAGGKPAPTA